MAEGRRRPAGPPRFVKDALRVLGGNVVMSALGVCSGVITARWLGPHDRGLFQLLSELPTMLSNFVKLGVPQASVYYMRRRGAPVAAVASNALWLAVVLGTAAALAGWTWREWLLANVLKDAPPALVAPTLALIPFVLLQFYLLGVAQAQERFHEYNIRQIVPNLLSLAGLVLFLVILGLGLVAAVLSQAAIVVFMSLWLAWRVHRETPMRLRVDRTLLRGMLGFGGKSYVQTLASTLHFRLDKYLIAYLLDPRHVAFYAIAANLSTLLLRVSDAGGTVLFPRLAASEQRDADAATARVCRHALFLTAVCGLGLAAAGPFLIPLLYGRPFAAAIPALLVLLPGVLAMALYQILTRSFTSRARQEINIAAAVTALGLNVALNWILVPRWGIVGAALAHDLSYGAAAAILLVAFLRHSGFSLRQTLLVRRDDLADLRRAAGRIAGRLPGLAGG